MIEIREVSAGDWEVLREVRLAALREAPYAFGSTYQREAAFTEAQWRGRVHDRAVTFFAYAVPVAEAGADADLTTGAGAEAGAGAGTAMPAGLAGVYVEDGAAEVVSMWVRPSARGLGAGGSLVEAAADWAKSRGYPALYLWVTESNEAARRLYEHCGFAPTGESQPLPSDPALREVRMRRPL